MKLSHYVYAFIVLLVVVVGFGLTNPFGTKDVRAINTDIRLTGSSTVAPVLVEISKRYEQNNGTPRVFVETGGSSKGIADLRKNLTDIAMISRPLKEEESDLVEYVIARDGIAILVHKDNPVAEISVDDLRSIFTGEITQWADVGGESQEIIVVSKGEGSATSVVLNEFLNITADQVAGEIFAAANAQMIKTVSLTPGSIGYVSIGAASVDIELGVPVKLISLGAVKATTENVANGTYLATRPLSLITYPEIEANVLALVKFSQSSVVSDIIEELAYTPVAQ